MQNKVAIHNLETLPRSACRAVCITCELGFSLHRTSRLQVSHILSELSFGIAHPLLSALHLFKSVLLIARFAVVSVLQAENIRSHGRCKKSTEFLLAHSLSFLLMSTWSPKAMSVFPTLCFQGISTWQYWHATAVSHQERQVMVILTSKA